MRIYTDSSYNWEETDKNGCGTGEICIAQSKTKFTREEITICVPGLRQLNNRMEMIAIRLALKRFGKYKKLEIFSDSRVAVSWTKDPRVKWIPREKNVAGIILEENP